MPTDEDSGLNDLASMLEIWRRNWLKRGYRLRITMGDDGIHGDDSQGDFLTIGLCRVFPKGEQL
jgi:hypothetical protein